MPTVELAVSAGVAGFIVCAAIADAKHRSVPSWAAAGYVVPAIAYVVIAQLIRFVRQIDW